MGLPDKYDRRLKDNLSLRAVWLPGNPIELGDVLQHREGTLQPISHLGDFGVRFQTKRPSQKISLSLQARGVSTTVVQAGTEVPLHQIDTKVAAELKIDFKGEDTYFIRTPKLVGTEIKSLLKVARAIKGHPEWRHGKYFIVTRVYRADDFVFLGNYSRSNSLRFGGIGQAILDFLTLGLSAQVSRTSSRSASIEIMGEGGPLVMDVVRVKKDGQVY